jgi:hypothetical protein
MISLVLYRKSIESYKDGWRKFGFVSNKNITTPQQRILIIGNALSPRTLIWLLKYPLIP